MKWPKTLTMKDAQKLQNLLRVKVRLSPLQEEPRYVAGVDAAFSRDSVFAASCLYLFPELVLIEQKHAIQRTAFPYVPGFLSFREGPAIIEAVRSLTNKPDIILFDGQGVAHSGGIGIASHIGVLLDMPTIGCAKTRLVGDFIEPGTRKGSWSQLLYNGRNVGAVLRSRDNVRPLFISPGHKIDLDNAIRLVLACTGRYRIPEPLRCADILSKKLKAKYLLFSE